MTNEELKLEVHQWAKKIGVESVEVHVRDMKRKWTSCSSKGRLSFNKAIMRESRDFLKEVIVHELLHLKYPNHGKMFKALMRGYLNPYNHLR